MKAKGSILLSIVLLGQVIAGVALATTSTYYLNQDNITPRTAISGVQVGGLKPDAAKEKLHEQFPQPTADSFLVFNDGEGDQWKVQFKNIKLAYDYETVINNTYQLGKEISPLRINQFYSLITSSKNFPLTVHFDKQALRETLQEISTEYNRQPKNAQVAYSEGQVVLLPETMGRKLDIEKTIAELQGLNPGEFSIKLVAEEKEPERTSEDLKDINELLAIFVTEIDITKKDGRVHNIELASDKINNVIIKPGELFSLNKTLGPRTKENGYVKAPVIINNQLVDDYGGGVCQVATTLYNVVLNAKMPVEERYPHTKLVDYAPPGQDATIAGNIKDFKFKNDGKHPIMIASKVNNGKLLISILGNEEDTQSIEYKTETDREVIEPKVIYKTNSDLKPGEMKVLEPGREGYYIKTYEVTVVNGKETERKLISNRQVEPKDTVILLSPSNKRNGVK
ncbi:MAG: vanomycin resistance protein VanB [Firmicutes bacterium]|nr:vanomycin resistance protein VanB [Bacillota bacterium]